MLSVLSGQGETWVRQEEVRRRDMRRVLMVLMVVGSGKDWIVTRNRLQSKYCPALPHLASSSTAGTTGLLVRRVTFTSQTCPESCFFILI